MKKQGFHTFHLVDQRPWPLTGAISALTLTSGIVKWFHQNNISLLLLGLTLILLTIWQWWRDISREATFQGLHTYKVTLGIRWGIILFIASEVLFFCLIFLSLFP